MTPVSRPGLLIVWVLLAAAPPRWPAAAVLWAHQERFSADAVAKDVGDKGDVWEVAQGDMRLTARLTPSAPRLSDELELELTLSAPASHPIAPLAIPSQLGDFRVLRSQVEPPRRRSSLLSQRVILWLEPLKPGVSQLEGVRWPLEDGRPDDGGPGRILELPAREVPVQISEGAGSATLDKLEPLEGPRQPPAPPREPNRSTWLAIAGGIVLLAVAAYLVLKRLRSTPAPLTETPAVEALRRIQQLDASAHSSTAKSLVTDLSAIVRTLIERTTELHAPELTTEEFLAQASAVFLEDDRQHLQRFLQQADEVKFARLSISPEEIRAMIETARNFIRRRAESDR